MKICFQEPIQVMKAAGSRQKVRKDGYEADIPEIGFQELVENILSIMNMPVSIQTDQSTGRNLNDLADGLQAAELIFSGSRVQTEGYILNLENPEINLQAVNGEFSPEGTGELGERPDLNPSVDLVNTGTADMADKTPKQPLVAASAVKTDIPKGNIDEAGIIDKEKVSIKAGIQNGKMETVSGFAAEYQDKISLKANQQAGTSGEAGLQETASGIETEVHKREMGLPEEAESRGEISAEETKRYEKITAQPHIQEKTPAETRSSPVDAENGQRNNRVENLDVIASRIKDEVTVLEDDSRSSLKVQLKPEKLGELEIRFQIKNGNLSGEILVETLSAKEVMESQLPDLKERLKHLNIILNEVDIALQSDHQEQEKGRRHGLFEEGNPRQRMSGQASGKEKAKDRQTHRLMHIRSHYGLTGSSLDLLA